jgi:hypothetical protein
MLSFVPGGGLAAEVRAVDHAALVGAYADGALAVAHLDLEAELAAVVDLAQLGCDRAAGPQP